MRKRFGAGSVNNKQAHSVQVMTKSNDDKVCICITHNVPVESTIRLFVRLSMNSSLLVEPRHFYFALRVLAKPLVQCVPNNLLL